MKIQSLSIVVPNKVCLNNCKFCVSKMRIEEYKNQLNENLPFYDLYLKDYITRLNFARDNGCNTMMLTGNSEPQQNRTFLNFIGTINKQLDKPFRIIEMQTTGILLDEGYLRFLRNHVGITTISLSISSFDDLENKKIVGMSSVIDWNLEKLCYLIKKYDFNLRLSINLLDSFEYTTPEELPENLIGKCKQLGADQITFRKMYLSNLNTPQDQWLKEHKLKDVYYDNFIKYIKQTGRVLGYLEFGATQYSIKEMSVVVDDDCMSTINKQEIKYLILRPDCKLYTKWDDKGSLLF